MQYFARAIVVAFCLPLAGRAFFARVVVAVALCSLPCGSCNILHGRLLSLERPACRLQVVQYFARVVVVTLFLSLRKSCNILHGRWLWLRSACRFAGRAIFCTDGCGCALLAALQVVQYFARVVVAVAFCLSLASRAIFCTGGCGCVHLVACKSCNILHGWWLRLRLACRFTGRAIFCTGSGCCCALLAACRSCNILHGRWLWLRPACRFVGRAIFCTGGCGCALLNALQVVQYFARAVVAVASCLSLRKSCNILHG